MESIPVEAKVKDVKEFDLNNDTPPTERALGVSWFVKADDVMCCILTALMSMQHIAYSYLYNPKYKAVRLFAMDFS